MCQLFFFQHDGRTIHVPLLFLLELNKQANPLMCQIFFSMAVEPFQACAFIISVRTEEGVELGQVVREVRQHPGDHYFKSQQWLSEIEAGGLAG
jgi:hypothetical protein